MPEPDRVKTRAQIKRRRRQKQERKCEECGQTFSKTEHLARHIRSHTKERPFQCELCEKTYSRHDSLLRHSRSHPSGAEDNVSSPLALGLSPTLSLERASNSSGEINTRIQQATLTSQDATPPTLASANWQATNRSNAFDDRQHNQGQLLHASFRTPDQAIAMHSLHWPNNISTRSGDLVGTTTSDIPANLQPVHSGFGYFDAGHTFHEPPWLLGSDFDFDSLNIPMMANLTEWSQHDSLNSFDYPRMPVGCNAFEDGGGQSSSLQLGSIVQQRWFTRFPRHDSDHASAMAPSNQDKVDEAYREGLTHRLQAPINSSALPSADFLNLCIKLYFSKFSPAFPVLHAASFRPSTQNALLLLSICSIGALFVGSSGATAQGRRIYRILNKACLASWEKIILGPDSRERLSLAQTALLGQTFGMLSAHSQDQYMTESFHGTVIAWARQCGCFHVKKSDEMVGDNDVDIERVWKEWAYNEESIRLVAGLYIHDSECATTFHHEPLLRHKPRELTMSCSDELFSAPNAIQWYALMRKNRARPVPIQPDGTDISHLISVRSHIYANALLAGILASIQESRHSDFDNTPLQTYRRILLQWHQVNSKYIPDTINSRQSLMILWHTAFLTLYADFDLLERAIGRDGEVNRQQAIEDAAFWADGSNVILGVLHVLLIRRHAENLVYGAEPAIHIPKALFFSGVLTYCYLRYRSAGIGSTESLSDSSIEEFRVSMPPESILHTKERLLPAMLSAVDTSVLCSCIDLLRRIGHWGISQKYASILETLLEDIAQSSD